MIGRRHVDNPQGGGERTVERWAAYVDVDRPLRDAGLCCRGAGEQLAGHHPQPTPRRLSTHGLVLVTAGAGIYLDENHPDPIPVLAPAVIWLAPGVSHAYTPDQQGWREHWVLFEGTTTRVLERPGVWTRRSPVLPANGSVLAEAEPAFARLRRVLAVPNRRAHAIAATAVSSVIGVAVEATSPQPGANATSVLEAIIDAAHIPLSVRDRAEDLGMSLEAFRAAVREATGLSPHELVVRTRIARAQQLLAETDTEVAAVARGVGWDDPAYFSRIFRRRIGVSPTQFRAQEGPRTTLAGEGQGRARS